MEHTANKDMGASDSWLNHPIIVILRYLREDNDEFKWKFWDSCVHQKKDKVIVCTGYMYIVALYIVHNDDMECSQHIIY